MNSCSVYLEGMIDAFPPVGLVAARAPCLLLPGKVGGNLIIVLLKDVC